MSMTETEWLTHIDPDPLLLFLCSQGGDRKLRLFACACCRRLWSLLVDERSRQAVEVAEKYADDLVGSRDIHWAAALNHQVIETAPSQSAIQVAARAVSAALGIGAWAAAWNVVAEARKSVHDKMLESRAQVGILRDIVGNPFRPTTIARAWLGWHDGCVVKIARWIYEERRFESMPILADALEEAGCDNPDLLQHCRQPGEHVRGCWVLDLLLKKAEPV
jgi:hypothetical protein